MVVPAGFPSFPCPQCGGALPATMAAGMVVPCPLCQQQIVVPAGGGPSAAQAAAYQAWALQHGNTAAAMHDQQARAQVPGAGPSLFASTASVVVVEDGAGGLVAVGAQVGGDGRWHVRGVDPGSRQVRWEAMHGSHFQTCPEVRSMCGRGGRIYVAHQGVLTAIDGPTGRGLWQARLSARIAVDVDGAALAGDETDLREVLTAHGGVVVVKTEDDALSAFDRDSGQALWQRRCEGHPQTDGRALFVCAEWHQYELLDPRSGQAVARFEASDGVLVPGALVLAVSDRGPDDQDGVALVDLATGQERWFVAAESVDLDQGVAIVGGEVLVPINGSAGTEILPVAPTGAAPKKGFFARLFGGGGGAGTRSLPWSKHNVSALWGHGDAIVIDAKDWDGHRRIAVVEPRSMTVRHDSGIIADGVAPGVRLGPGGQVAYAFGESNGPKTLRLVDVPSGGVRWERQLDDLDEVAFRAGQLVLRTDGAPVELVDPASGQTRVTF